MKGLWGSEKQAKIVPRPRFVVCRPVPRDKSRHRPRLFVVGRRCPFRQSVQRVGSGCSGDDPTVILEVDGQDRSSQRGWRGDDCGVGNLDPSGHVNTQRCDDLDGRFGYGVTVNGGPNHNGGSNDHVGIGGLGVDDRRSGYVGESGQAGSDDHDDQRRSGRPRLTSHAAEAEQGNQPTNTSARSGQQARYCCQQPEEYNTGGRGDGDRSQGQQQIDATACFGHLVDVDPSPHHGNGGHRHDDNDRITDKATSRH